MRVRLIVEGRDFTISAPAIERLRLLEGSIGLEPQRSQSEVSRQRFQRFEHAPADAKSARVGTHPHALDFADVSILHLERAATDRLPPAPRPRQTPRPTPPPPPPP